MVYTLEKKQDELLKLFFQMLRIRKVEESIASAYSKQEMRTPVHLSIGQEAAAAVSCAFLTAKDYAVSSHRAHAHYLAKGGCLKKMIAEIHGKVTGCCRGRGGSMHLIDQSVGFMGSTAIVGNTIPIGVGLGLALQLDGESSHLSCIFLGDGAVEEGAFYESVNFSALRNLPVLFVCENNMYSVYTPIHKRQPRGRKIHEMVSGMGIKTFFENGYDAMASYDAMSAAVSFVRQQRVPCFIELSTYRWREHCGPGFDNNIGYRAEEEYHEWLRNDPLEKLREYLVRNLFLTKEALAQMEHDISLEIHEAFEFARLSAFPSAIEASSGEYYQRSIKEGIACVN